MRCIGIRKPNALIRKPINVRRLMEITSVTGEIHDPKIIHQEEHHIHRAGTRCGKGL
jgi:hypothetical protein